MKNNIKFFMTLLFLVTIFNLSFSQVQIGGDIDGTEPGDLSGFSVSLALNGNRVAIGAPQVLWDSVPGNENDTGYVKIYDLLGNVWMQVGETIYGIEGKDGFGFSVSLSSNGNRVAIVALYWSDSEGFLNRYVRILEYNGGNWIQVGEDIIGEDEGDHSESTIALSSDGNRIVIGAPYNNGNGYLRGHVRIYDWNGGEWTQVGDDIDGKANNNHSGSSVSLSSDGNRVAIGAPYAYGVGCVRIYDWNGTAWTQAGEDIIGEAANDLSGSSVSLSSDGNRIAIGAPDNYGIANQSGHVRVYEWIGGIWTQIGEDISGKLEGERSGISISLSSDGKRIAIRSGNYETSLVRIYEWIGGVWKKMGTTINEDNLVLGCLFGCGGLTLSTDGNKVAIGTPLAINDDGFVVGHVRIFDLSLLSSVGSITEIGINIFPNPTSDFIEIDKRDNPEINIQIIDNSGKTLFSKTSNNQITKLGLSNYASGVYHLIISNGKSTVTKKIMKL